MKECRYIEEQIIAALMEVDAGRKVEEVTRKLGITQTTFYWWRAKFGGMNVGEARRPRHIEDENRRLKQVVADLTLDNQALKSVLKRKW